MNQNLKPEVLYHTKGIYVKRKHYLAMRREARKLAEALEEHVRLTRSTHATNAALESWSKFLRGEG